MKPIVLFLFIASSFASAQWEQTNLSSTSHISEFALRGTALFVATYGDGFFRTTVSGDAWATLNNGLTNKTLTSIALADSSLFFVGAWPGGVYRSTNAGSNWFAMNSGLTNTNVQSVIAIHDSSSGNFTLLAGTFNGGIFRSTNLGSNWSASNTGLTNLVVYTFMMTPHGIFAGTDSGAFVSVDTGKTWSAAGLSGKVVRVFALSDSGLFAGSADTSGGVYRSINYGGTWERIDSTLPSKNVWAVAMTENIILAGTIGGGIYRSSDQGVTWTGFNTGITSANVQALIFDNRSGYVFAGTDHVGVWRRPISEIIAAVHEASATPAFHRLFQNYPNPFNPSTTIRFAIARAENVELKVYDVRGRLVVILFDEWKDPGQYTAQWNTESMPSGAYFIRLTAGQFTQTQKMLLLK